MMKKNVQHLLIGAAISATTLAASSAWAKTVLTVSTWGSPNHGINTTVWPEWGEAIEEATEGRVTLDVVYDLGPPQAQMDLVADGVGDVSWIFHGHYPGRFSATQLPELPYFVDISSEDMSKAYWRVYSDYLSKANEHRGVEVLGVGVHGPGQVFTKEPVTGWADLDGQRMRVGGGIMNTIAEDLGIAGVALPPTGTFEAASQGVISGALLTLEALKSFRLADVFPYTYQVPGGLYRGSFSIVVNPDRWAQIDAADQEAIKAVSGEQLSALFGRMMDEQDAIAVEYAKGIGHTFNHVDDAALAEIKELTAKLPEQWVAGNEGNGYDAQAALDAFQKDIGVDQ
ncbi:TRAP transporter substrate-binding protein [Suttonella sp. R2A3]|uniref:TRAP transporter substrate-binding protein n=1 Tax=Suttonella sp. R2A3 TaxID=2908648 RepID=UPI001F18C6BB|nr:TRAP transporter substrate-binding protein [Suttonella sp. R2A3]UJF24215.1 TRAP transporter substrate-binding protein [Suttonella sp. R2A3]